MGPENSVLVSAAIRRDASSASTAGNGKMRPVDTESGPKMDPGGSVHVSAEI